ncbi:MAG: IucA/IucC family siderophore biosynthesis protein [Sinomonas sp.]|nr:IucA/IucC family siderophore biosynthesis protein [Sinomonas sp.]
MSAVAPERTHALAGLACRVVDSLLREDHLGIQSSGRPVHGPTSGGHGGPWWRAPLPGGRTLHLPVRPDGFLAEYRVAAPFILVEDAAGGVARADSIVEILGELAPRNDAEAEAGWVDFCEECRQCADVVSLHDTEAPRLAERLAADPRRPRGFAGLLLHESAAAVRDHPVHPTGRCRWGLSEDEIRAYAPEFLPEFRLAWTLVPRDELRFSPALEGALPAWWPAASEFGQEGRGTQGAWAGRELVALPVHPLTVARGEVAAVGRPGPLVVPTLSTRTVALADDPSTHLKLPLPTASLGRRNRRTIKPGTLAGGEAMQRLLEEVLEREPQFAQRILLADELRWADSGSDLHAVLIREYPRAVASDVLAPVAGLLAPAPGDPALRVLDRLAAEAGQAAEQWLDAYTSLLLDWHVALWLRYGIALEAHQQNITVAQGRDGLRLVYKDNDSARIDCSRASAALGRAVRAEDFGDPRIAAHEPSELADMFTTITLHLCTAALVVEAVGDDGAARAATFARVRAHLEESCERWTDPADARSRAAAELLRARILDADRLPIKGMLTAGTLLPKERLGCADINKFYLRTGPNYLALPGSAALSRGPRRA